ncbi:uncharacterized protein LOC116298688 [Actinia tenebrosa]|uniref:Uncharacterized protein LOC116298688 n=1 Tax=Actinia tenebrosa TaxID=6105 RepID=A0A6P8I579_ACTTE|nr:uncharacterized protein LOC116298688 [Actinia tenebrosa]
MSAGRKRLEDALQVGKEIENSQNNGSTPVAAHGLPKVSSIKDLDFGDIMGVFSVHLSQNAQFLAAGCGNGAVQVYSMESGKKRRPLKHGSLYGLPVTTVKFLPYKDDKLMSTSSDGTITCWDLNGWCTLSTVDEIQNEISALDFSHDGKIFATAGKDHNVRVYDTETMQMKILFAGAEITERAVDLDVVKPESGHGRKVFGLKFHPFDDNVFLTGGWDRCLKIWDVRVDQVVRSINGPYICGDGIDIFQDDILTASWLNQNALQVWDYTSGKLIEDIPFPCHEHGEFLYVGRFLWKEVVIAGGSGTNDVKIISRNPYKVIDSIDDEGKPIQALDVLTGAQLIALGGTGTHVKLVSLST